MKIVPRHFAVLALLIAFLADTRAGTLNDSAGLFGTRGEEVRSALADLPVSIETRRARPPEGLRAYADQRAYNEFERGFVVVITTEPRGWRISMFPQSLASPVHVRILGDRMAASFKHGQYVEGATQLATSLNQLTLLQAAPPTPVTTAPVSRPAKPVPTYPTPIRHSTYASPFAAVFLVMFVGILAMFLTAFFFVRSRKRYQFRPPANAEDARRVFSAYTPAQRERLSSRHAAHAAGDVLNDPMSFAMMMYMVQLNSASSIASSPSSLDTTSSSFSSSFDSSSSSSSSSISSSSDSSGASGSW